MSSYQLTIIKTSTTDIASKDADHIVYHDAYTNDAMSVDGDEDEGEDAMSVDGDEEAMGVDGDEDAMSVDGDEDAMSVDEEDEDAMSVDDDGFIL
jgi:hypothetical protein